MNPRFQGAPIKILTVVGARPQFIKASVVSRALVEAGDVEEVIVHTGQHYDANMSAVFFDQLGIPEPRYNLEVGSGSHGATTAQMLDGIEKVLMTEKPSAVLLYGDTNSTLAGALAASKLHIPIAHVEAGLRSFNPAMPEEVNRVLTDMVASLMCCPTVLAVQNLAQMGRVDGVHLVGDVMLDASNLCREVFASDLQRFREEQGLAVGDYALATVHRAENTDDPARLAEIFEALERVAEDLPVVLPLHPRTKLALERTGIGSEALHVLPPVSYVQMLALEEGARVILTDSGGVQKEAFFVGVPCVTLRDETEWEETVQSGWNMIAGADRDEIVAAALGAEIPGHRPEPYGAGDAGPIIARVLVDYLRAAEA